MARPYKQLDLKAIENMASIGCTNTEIALISDCSVDTVTRRCADIVSKGRARGRATLRRLQWQLATKGNATMLIWLGKNTLGQSDQIKTENENTTRIVIERMPPTLRE